MEQNYHIEKFNIELKKLPHFIENNAKDIKGFLRQLIDLGSQLDQLFALGDIENPDYPLHEGLISAYNRWSIGVGHTLLTSRFGTKRDLRIKYSVLTEYDGVDGVVLPLQHPGKFNGALSLNPKIRFGIGRQGDSFVGITKEGLKQFKNARIFLKKKLEALSKIFREELENAKSLSSDRSTKTPTSRTFYFNESTGELSRYPKEKNKVCTFQPNKGRYKIMISLVREKVENNGIYVPTKELADVGHYKGNQECRITISKMRDIISETFSKTSLLRLGQEFIESKQEEGYRIGKKFEVFFEETF